jgi:hypothetical protein
MKYLYKKSLKGTELPMKPTERLEISTENCFGKIQPFL